MGLLTILKKMKQKEKEIRLLMLYLFDLRAFCGALVLDKYKQTLEFDLAREYYEHFYYIFTDWWLLDRDTLLKKWFLLLP